MIVRPEQPADLPAIHALNEQAFERAGEANLVDCLRDTCPGFLSWVAILDGAVTGHLLFTPVRIESKGETARGMGLGPVAVAPVHQRQGIGTRLISTGLEALRERGVPFVVVLGSPDYYARFGFVPASRHGIACPWPGIPDPVFMVLIMNSAFMQEVAGVAHYHEAFDAVT